MKKTRNSFVVGCFLVLGLLVAGCGVISVTKLPVPDPDENLIFLLKDDFSGNEIGSEPAGWSITANTRAASTIEVIEDEELDTGHAVRFKTSVVDPAFTASFSTPFSPSEASLANAISIDFALKWIEGGSININVSNGSNF